MIALAQSLRLAGITVEPGQICATAHRARCPTGHFVLFGLDFNFTREPENPDQRAAATPVTGCRGVEAAVAGRVPGTLVVPSSGTRATKALAVGEEAAAIASGIFDKTAARSSALFAAISVKAASSIVSRLALAPLMKTKSSFAASAAYWHHRHPKSAHMSRLLRRATRSKNRAPDSSPFWHRPD